MSKRYPIDAGHCETCRNPLMADAQGKVRPHTCWVQWNGDPTPWPWFNQRQAADKLGVTPEYLDKRFDRFRGRIRRVYVVRIEDVGASHAHSFARYSRDDVLKIQADA